MKRVVIGCCLLFAGVINTIGIIISASIYLPHMTAWLTNYPSKLMFLIFAGNSQFNDGADGLGLGMFFIFGIILILLGMFILYKEYFDRRKNEDITN